jgi:hypothetical protein
LNIKNTIIYIPKLEEGVFAAVGCGAFNSSAYGEDD